MEILRRPYPCGKSGPVSFPHCPRILISSCTNSIAVTRAQPAASLTLIIPAASAPRQYLAVSRVRVGVVWCGVVFANPISAAELYIHPNLLLTSLYRWYRSFKLYTASHSRPSHSRPDTTTAYVVCTLESTERSNNHTRCLYSQEIRSFLASMAKNSGGLNFPYVHFAPPAIHGLSVSQANSISVLMSNACVQRLRACFENERISTNH